ncbi:Casein kinase I isoform alpha [Mycena venus]|uniref:Casein kinase I isoform alpha n=1 Tax=Mycena venus TaxID=2733690 RepID=A0A8H6X7V3_9AGAR|nr:Casein kinase I isoform alpha [Mycena venus]
MSKLEAEYTLLSNAEGDADVLESPSPDTSDHDADDEDTQVESENHKKEASDPRFVQPAGWKRTFLFCLVLFCSWLAFQYKGRSTTPKVVHANRYSREFKYRPAASPIVTETLKDGRIRVRGAAPTTSTAPTPTAAKKTRSKSKSGRKRSGKGKGVKRSAIGKTGK